MTRIRLLLKIIAISAFGTTLTANATAAGIVPTPFSAQPVKSFKKSDILSKDSSRLRLTVAVSDTADKSTIRLGGVVICSTSACFKPQSLDYFKAVNTSQGNAELIVDTIVPISKITSVYFEPTTGSQKVEGSIKLDTPLNIEEGYLGAEIFVTLEKKRIANQDIYSPIASSSSLWNPELFTLHYDPKVATKVDLDYATTFSIPAQSLSKPQLFSVSVRDVGDRMPMVDIYPNINFKKQATIESSGVNQSKTAALTIPATPSTGRVPTSIRLLSQPSNADTTKKTIQISKTGTFKDEDFSNSSLQNSEKMTQTNALAAAAASCASVITQNMNTITSLSSGSGVVNVQYCENIPPYIHIAYINTADSRIKYSIPATYNHSQPPGTNGWYPYYLHLLPITTYANTSIVAINGFVWSGDQGTADGQIGTPEGYLDSAFLPLGINSAGGNKLVMGYGTSLNQLHFFETSQVHANLSPYDYMAVSSSTSVIKNNVCSTDTTNNRWSAVGSVNGRMVMLSSTSSGTTSAADLCSIFRAFGIQNALRLDGGPSTAMLINQKVVNPITGVASLKYGSLRRIAYPLRISW
jgi:hypothetical protein